MSKIEIEASKLQFTVAGVEYTWVGGFGAMFTSRERVKAGTVRYIGSQLFYAYMVSGRFKKEVGWTVANVNADVVREIKAAIFK